MTRAVAVAAALAALAASAAATAARAPTHNERVAIVRALPAEIRAYPAGCVVFEVSVSGNGRWAKASMDYLIPSPPPNNDPCVRYASNGAWLLERTNTTWKVVYEASELPGCSLGAPRDLIACAKGR